MPKKLTKREKAHLFSEELKKIDQQERDKKLCMEVASGLKINLMEENGVIYSIEGESRQVFHTPINPQKIWTEARWILQELCYQDLKKRGKVADREAQFRKSLDDAKS